MNRVQVAISRALAPARHAIEGKILHAANQTLGEGLSVFVQADLTDGLVLTAQIVSALHLLAVSDPRRCARVRHDLSSVYVDRATGPELWRATRTCVLPARLVRAAPPEWLASLVVHEATHARLGWRQGHRTDTRLALETCCVRAQTAFLRQLPVAKFPQRDELLAFLSQAISNPWWKGPGLMRRRRQTLADMGAPEWLQYFVTGGVIAKPPPKT